MTNRILLGESAQYYECGFSCDNGVFVALDDKKYFITDGRYTQEAKEYAKSVEVLESRDLIGATRKLMRSHGIRSITVDPNEWKYSDFIALTSKLSYINFIKKPNFSQTMRAVKSSKELDLIKTAIQENADAFSSFASFLSNHGEGKTEAELHYEAKRFLSGAGARDLSFDPIFAINANAAKPHALPTKDRLKAGDLILFDAGTKHQRFCSDRTRTAQFGSDGISFEIEQQFNSPKRQKIYDLVLKAHNEAIAGAKSGMRAKELDLIARKVIDSAGYGKFFNHSLGHGVGIDIHEYPFINSKSEFVLEDGMVFTIEPGVYLPNEFGVRIESVVVLQNGAATVL